jgi:hypothetical protein
MRRMRRGGVWFASQERGRRRYEQWTRNVKIL